VKVVYVAHPLAGDFEGNIAKALRWFGYFVKNYSEYAFVMDWVLACMVLDDRVPEHRTRGIGMNDVVLPRCDEVWFCGGHMSPGMQKEYGQAVQNGMTVASFVRYGSEPPEGRVEPQIEEKGPRVGNPLAF
jgi:hypothetical protein